MADFTVSISGDVNLTQTSSTPNEDIETSVVTITDIDGGTALTPTPIADRKSLIIENVGSKTIYVGKLGNVLAGNGLRVLPNSNLTLNIGPDIQAAAVCAAGESSEIRLLQIA